MSGDKAKKKKSLGIVIIVSCIIMVILLNVVYIKQRERLDKARQENLKYNGKLSMDGFNEFAAIRKDGFLYYVMGIGMDNDIYGRDEIVEWEGKKFINISIGTIGIFGLCEDGNIVGITGIIEKFRMIEQEVEAWTNIKKVEAGYDMVLGLKEDGTVVAAGASKRYPSATEEVLEWKNIIEIQAVEDSIIGLTEEGKVVLSGLLAEMNNEEIKKYDDITDMAISVFSMMLVHKTGEVSVIELGQKGKKVPGWSDIIQVVSSGQAASPFYAGLKADGTVVTYGNFQGDVARLENIVFIDAGYRIMVALDKNGVVHIVTDPRKSLEEWDKRYQLKIDGYNINQ